MRLNFVHFNADSTSVVFIAGVSFASNKDMTSQLGCVINLDEKNNKANIANYSSFKRKQVMKSVLVAVLFEVVHAFDYASTFRATISDQFGGLIVIAMYTDTISLYEALNGI